MSNRNPYPCCGNNGPVARPTPPPPGVCWVYTFSMLDPGDVLFGITYDSGAEFANLFGYALSNSDSDIANAIKAALDGAGFTYDDVIVQSIGSTLKDFVITIQTPGGTLTSNIFLNGGSPFYPAVLTDCT